MHSFDYHSFLWICFILKTIHIYIYIYIYIYILGVARYTDVTARYVTRFGGHILIQLEEKNLQCSISFNLF